MANRKRSQIMDETINVYDSEQEFLTEIKEMQRNSTWEPVKTHLMSIRSASPIEGNSIMEEEGCISSQQQLHECLTNGTQWLLKPNRTKNECYALLGSAIKTLTARAHLSGASLWKADPRMLETFLNHCFTKWAENGQMLLRYNCVSAIHSSQYISLDQLELVNSLRDVMRERFGDDAIFKSGSISNSMTIAVYTFKANAQKELFDMYKKLKINSNFNPAIRFSTSDTADSAARVIPCFNIGKTGVVLPIGDGIEVVHKGKNVLYTFKEKAKALVPLFQKSSIRMQKLSETEIVHPIDCFKNICKKRNIAMSYYAPVLESFEKAYNPECKVTAFDLYLEMVEVLSVAKKTLAEHQMFELEERVAGSLFLDWNTSDYKNYED